MSLISYVTVAEFVDRVGVNETIELSDLWDALNDSIDSSKINTALIAASREVDSYIRQRYVTPVVPTPWELMQPVTAIARYRLSNLDRDSRIRIDYDDAIKYLGLIAKGLVGLDLVSTDLPVNPEQRVYSEAGPSDWIGGCSRTEVDTWGYL